MNNADDFFKDLDKKRPNFSAIDHNTINTDGLVDKTTLPPVDWKDYSGDNEPKAAQYENASANSAEDFFADLDRRKKKRQATLLLESPEVTGLREEPAPDPEIVLEGLDTSAVSTGGLREEIDPNAVPEVEIEVI